MALLHWRKALTWLLFSTLSFLLSACVVQPLYQENGNQKLLKQLKIDCPRTRFEQLLGQQLHLAFAIDNMAAVAPKYGLNLQADYHFRTDSADNADNDNVTLSLLYAHLHYKIYNLLDRRSIKQGDLVTSVPYNKIYEGYATYIAEKAALRQAAYDLANQLRLELLSQ